MISAMTHVFRADGGSVLRLMMAWLLVGAAVVAGAVDPRDLRSGLPIPDEAYCDQPYVVVLPSGAWLCTMTTGAGREGQKGQHIVSTVSRDQGRTWSPLVDVEPATGPEASWAIPLVTSFGRVYVFYTYNGDDIRELNGKPIRSDVHGWYAFRYTDDEGRTWSQRHRLPLRITDADRNNDWQGRVQMFWGIDKPHTFDGKAYFSFTKLGKHFLEKGEGWMFVSNNILTERDVNKLHWELLPEGERGVRNDAFGSVQEEHVSAALSTGDMVMYYRTTRGHIAQSISRDGGRSWSQPTPAVYTPDGRTIKHPRACTKIWRTADGRYLLWFHNNGLQTWNGRNPVWVAGGIEKDGHIHWSQPEILLYDRNPDVRISYPDLIEQDGRFWITETQKTEARIHAIDPQLFEGMWRQGIDREVTYDGAVMIWAESEPGPFIPELGSGAAGNGFIINLDKRLDNQNTRGFVVPKPNLGNLAKGDGFTIDLRVRFGDLNEGQVLLDTRDETGRGVAVTTSAHETVRIHFSDGTHEATWDCDPGLLTADREHHITFIVDGGPKIVSVLVDGVLCDGGVHRPFGWGRFHHELSDVNSGSMLRVAPSLHGRLLSFRLYNRYLRTSEAVANYHAERSR